MVGNRERKSFSSSQSDRLSNGAGSAWTRSYTHIHTNARTHAQTVSSPLPPDPLPLIYYFLKKAQNKTQGGTTPLGPAVLIQWLLPALKKSAWAWEGGEHATTQRPDLLCTELQAFPARVTFLPASVAPSAKQEQRALHVQHVSGILPWQEACRGEGGGICHTQTLNCFPQSIPTCLFCV